MQVALLAARLILFAVFFASGTAKLADRRLARQSLVAFGVSERFAGPLAIAQIVAELGTAVALLPLAALPYGSIASLALLLIFTLALVVNLARGRRPPCNCF
jgi:hypothetical protein